LTFDQQVNFHSSITLFGIHWLTLPKEWFHLSSES